ncbi:hypothetical protein CRX72_15055 [Pantoea sp. BRM17]|nr:hypothetical protein CRX72_15055 [Pantoea sp. BRM17]
MDYQLDINQTDFIQRYWQKRPVVLKRGFKNFVDPLSPDELAGLAMENEVDSRLVSHHNDKWQVSGRDRGWGWRWCGIFLNSMPEPSAPLPARWAARAWKWCSGGRKLHITASRTGCGLLYLPAIIAPTGTSAIRTILWKCSATYSITPVNIAWSLLKSARARLTRRCICLSTMTGRVFLKASAI